jgi:hypothetical protein
LENSGTRTAPPAATGGTRHRPFPRRPYFAGFQTEYVTTGPTGGSLGHPCLPVFPKTAGKALERTPGYDSARTRPDLRPV